MPSSIKLCLLHVGHIVAVDSVSPTVFCIGEAGDLIKWFDCSDYMREPSDIAISCNEYFVCDFKVSCTISLVTRHSCPLFNAPLCFIAGGSHLKNHSFAYPLPDVGALMDLRYIRRSSAVRHTSRLKSEFSFA